MKFVFGAFLILSVFFSAGYWVGTHPTYYDRYLDLTKSEIVFYSQDSGQLFPAAFKAEILSSSPTKINFISAAPEGADVLLVDATFLKNQTFLKATPDHDWALAFDKVSPDFQMEIFKKYAAIPVLWKEQQGKIRILSLTINSTKDKKNRWGRKFIEFALSKDFYMRWMKYHDWNSTLLKVDESSLDEKRKASYLRQLKLDNLQVF